MNCKINLLLIVLIIAWVSSLHACTIFSAKAKDGHVWAGNNEDYYLPFSFFLNVVPQTDSSFGYIYFSAWGPGGFPQGGMNEAGLFFDWNALLPGKTTYKDFDKKIDLPGGAALLNHVMSKCKTIQEVLNLFKVYKCPGLETGQLHLADKYGNLGIIVADSMWITKSNYQVSTNYNLCHPDKDGVTCWRFPIADSILRTKEPGFETFREICKSTSRKTKLCTVYSNIHDLTTGDIWFYYGMDYDKVYKTTLKDLLVKGDTSFHMYELFLNEPLVKVYKTYLSKGVKKSLKQLNDYDLSEIRRNEILRLLSLELVVYNHEYKCYPFLSELMRTSKEIDEYLQVYNAVSLFSIEKRNGAIKSLKKYLIVNPTSSLAQNCYNHMQGIFEDGSNVKFELPGYNKSKYVFVECIAYPNIKYFLIPKEGKWIGEFKLLPGEVWYYFLVDGKRVVDPNNKDIFTDTEDNGHQYNILHVTN